MKIITQNRKAFFDYNILDKLEAGMILTGDEVKSIKAGHVSLLGSYAIARDNGLFLINCKVVPYEKAFQKNDEAATRTRKLLVHKKELMRMIGDISRKGITIIPLKIYLKNGFVKVELGIAKHKKAEGKKQALKERDIARETAKTLKGYRQNR
jgi:SsrA-binding protein